jgi:hypothetical protein
MGGRIGYTIHNGQWRTKTGSPAFIEVIIRHPLPFIDHSYAAGPFFIQSKENIILYRIIITMSQHHTALALPEKIATDHIASRFY